MAGGRGDPALVFLPPQQSPGSVPIAPLPGLETMGPSCCQLCCRTAPDTCLSDTSPQVCLKSCWGKNSDQASFQQDVGRTRLCTWGPSKDLDAPVLFLDP